MKYMLFLKNVLHCITGLFKLFKTAHCLQGKILIFVGAQSTNVLVLVKDFQSLLALGFHAQLCIACSCWVSHLVSDLRDLVRVPSTKSKWFGTWITLSDSSDFSLAVSVSRKSFLALQIVIGTIRRYPVGTKRLHFYWSDVGVFPHYYWFS